MASAVTRSIVNRVKSRGQLKKKAKGVSWSMNLVEEKIIFHLVVMKFRKLTIHTTALLLLRQGVILTLRKGRSVQRKHPQ